MPDHKKYQAERNKLIPHAARFADEKFGAIFKDGDKELWVKNWNRAFLGEMAKLAKEMKL